MISYSQGAADFGNARTTLARVDCSCAAGVIDRLRRTPIDVAAAYANR
jgi:hypothetical protein